MLLKRHRSRGENLCKGMLEDLPTKDRHSRTLTKATNPASDEFKSENLTAIPMPRIWSAGTLRALNMALHSWARSALESVNLFIVTLRLTLSHGPWPRNLMGSGALPFLRFSFRLMHLPLTLASSSLLCTSPAKISCSVQMYQFVAITSPVSFGSMANMLFLADASKMAVSTNPHKSCLKLLAKLQ